MNGLLMLMHYMHSFPAACFTKIIDLPVISHAAGANLLWPLISILVVTDKLGMEASLYSCMCTKQSFHATALPIFVHYMY